jgi:hypothetical protein
VARVTLVARRAGEDSLSFEVVWVADGKPVNFEGLAKTIRAEREHRRPPLKPEW